MRRRVLDVIRSPKEFLRMARPRPWTNPPRRMGNDTAGPRFLFVKRQPQRRCPVVFGPEGSLASSRNDNLLANATCRLSFSSIAARFSPRFSRSTTCLFWPLCNGDEGTLKEAGPRRFPQPLLRNYQ